MTLYIVGSPIGNRDDITVRALRVLKSVDWVYAEKSLETSKLLKLHGIDKKVYLYHQHRPDKQREIIDRLRLGQSVAYLSEAGTPNLSDPGRALVAAALESGFKVEPIPGVSALTTLISVTPWPITEFSFVGFLPTKKGRQTKIKSFSSAKRPLVIFESPHRLLKLFESLAEAGLGERQLVVGRELTKLHEEIWSGTAAQAQEKFSKEKVRGELTLILFP